MSNQANTLSPFLQELKDTGTLTFHTTEDSKQQGVEATVQVSWPPPRWMYDAAKLCPYGAHVSWNTRGTVNGSSEPVTLTITGDLEVAVAFYSSAAKDIWTTASYRLTDHWRIEPIA